MQEAGESGVEDAPAGDRKGVRLALAPPHLHPGRDLVPEDSPGFRGPADPTPGRAPGRGLGV